MNTEIYVCKDIIEIEFTLADDCKFNILLTAGEAEDIASKLDQAAVCARNGQIVWRDRIT